MWCIIIRKQFVSSAFEGTSEYSGTVTLKVRGISLDAQEQVFSADSHTFVREQQHKKPTTVQLIFNFTHAHMRLWNYTINISTYTLITCEHSKEQ